MERTDPDVAADERTTLTQFLDYQRGTAVWKCEGLNREQLGRTTAASSLTLAGILKHLALVEDYWFQVMLLGREALPRWRDVDWDADPDWEFRTALEEEPADLVAHYREVCAASREAVAQFDSLDALSVGQRRNGKRFSVRWLLLHQLEETARHNGHADLLREAIDGVTGA